MPPATQPKPPSNQPAAKTRQSTDFKDADVCLKPPADTLKGITADDIASGKVPPHLVQAVAHAQLGLPKHLSLLLRNRFQEPLNPTDNIMFTCGVRDAIRRLLSVSSRSAVMTMSPYYPGYKDVVPKKEHNPQDKKSDGEENIIDVPLLNSTRLEEPHYRMNLSQCERAFRDHGARIAATIISAPNTPTSQFPEDGELRRLEILCSKNSSILIVDNTFDIFELTDQYAPQKLPLANTLYVGSLSEAFSLSQYEMKLGFVAGPAHLIQKIKSADQQQFPPPSPLAELAAYRVICASEEYRDNLTEEIRWRHAFAEKKLGLLPGVVALSPQGGTSKLVQFRHGFPEQSIVEALQQEGLAVKCGTDYGMRDTIRISLVGQRNREEFAAGINKLVHSKVWSSAPDPSSWDSDIKLPKG